MDNAKIRAAIAAVEHQVAALSSATAPLSKESLDEIGRGLASSWSAMVTLLAIPPAPETRECPRCHNVGMRAATLCGHCWTHLDRLEPLAAVAHAT